MCVRCAGLSFVHWSRNDALGSEGGDVFLVEVIVIVCLTFSANVSKRQEKLTSLNEL